MNNYIIRGVQIDVNGLCNSGCWFCPVSYAGNPKQAINDMTISELENIFKQLTEGKNEFVDPTLDLIYSANYNEVLLYKHFEEMLELYRKYKFKTYILTNGISLNKSRVNIMLKYPDVVQGILLNIPASDEETWSAYVNKDKKLFKTVIKNVRYAQEKLKHLVEKDWGLVLMVNGIDNRSLTDNGGWIDLLPNAPKLNLDEKDGTLKQQIEGFEKLLPGLQITESYHLYDRAAHLEKYQIFTQRPAIDKYLKTKNSKVIGCNGGIGVRSRTNEWVHINPNGDLFICCADYDFETIYGNINNTSLKEIWNSKDRSDMIKSSYADMCTKCSAAVWG
jgi:MoaA/NifB/PqqE/SkfB family radical SAM enzyme